MNKQKPEQTHNHSPAQGDHSELDSMLQSLSSNSSTSVRDRIIPPETLTLEALNGLFRQTDWNCAIEGQQPHLTLTLGESPSIALFRLPDRLRLIRHWFLNPDKSVEQKLGFLNSLSLTYFASFCYLASLPDDVHQDWQGAIEPELTYAQYDYFCANGVTFSQLAFICERFAIENKCFALEAIQRGFLDNTYVVSPSRQFANQCNEAHGYLAETP
jgi:hypothetical protein